MTIYFHTVGYMFVVFAIAMLCYRCFFVLSGRQVLGKVTDFVYRQSFQDNGVSRARHLKIRYVDGRGQQQVYVSDNGLLAYCFQLDDPIKLVEKNGKVIVSTLINLVTAPTALLVLGWAALAV
jgi:hypothetical protein